MNDMETDGSRRVTTGKAEASAVLYIAGLFGLCGFAVAQPLLSLLGEEPTYFVVHGVGGLRLVVFVLIVVLVPPAILSIPVLAAHLVSASAGRVVMTVAVGILVAVTVVSAIDRSAGLAVPVYIVLLVVVAAGCALAYRAWSPARLFVTYVSPSPILFAALFLFASPSSALLGGRDAEVLDAQPLDTPVVVVVFDEFALGVLLNADGTLDTDHFPNFGRLADQSTWYPNATTTAFRTDVAVPTILSGTVGTAGVPPTAAEYPRSLFSMLGSSYDVVADEAVTEICPNPICARAAAPAQDTIVEDTAVVYLHGLLPDGLADRWLPALGARWAGFADAGEDVAAEVSVGTCDNPVCAPDWDTARYQAFIDTIRPPSERPQLLYHHALLPHIPYRYLPSGAFYESISPTWGLTPFWIDDPDFMAMMGQRYFLQAMFVDRLLGELLDKLEAEDVLDDAVVVVVADHGVSLEPGSPLRGPEVGEDETRHAVHPVPLFVKVPGQAEGAVDPRPAQIVDVVPTIAEVVGVDLPSSWSFDGRSLLGPVPAPGPRRWFDGELSSDLDPAGVGAQLRENLVELDGRTDFLGVGPHGALIGERLSALEVVDEEAGELELDRAAAFDDVDPAGALPLLATGTVRGPTPDDWVAFAIGDEIAGVGPVYEDDGIRVAALLDPDALEPGSNTIRAFVVSADGNTLTPLRIGG